MDVNQMIDAIRSVDDEQTLFMIESVTSTEGFFTTEKKLLFVAKDAEGYLTEGIETDYLKLQTHVHISAVENDHTFENDDYNIIIFKGELKGDNIEAFVHLCEIYAYNSCELGFKEFFYSLIQIFQLPSEQSYINAVGLYGELKILQYAYKTHGVDISRCWHIKGSKSKYDFSNGEECIEVKTTSSEDCKISIKHSQIFEDEKCCLAVVICDQTDNGETLEELVRFFRESEGFNGIEFAINLEKEKSRISKSDFLKQRFRLQNIMFYRTENVNPFDDLPDNVFSLEYKMDLSEEEYLQEPDIKEILKRLTVDK